MPSSTLRRRAGRFTATLSLITACALMAACGGGDDATPADPGTGSPQQGGDTPQTAAGFTLSLNLDRTPVLQGHDVVVTVTVQRDSGFTEPVQLQVSGLPSGVSAAPVLVAAGQSQAQLRLQAQGSAPHSLPTGATVQGTASGRSASKPLTVTVRGLPGSVDTSFAGAGAPVTAVGGGEDAARAAAVQADGKLVMAGSASDNAGTHIAVLRLQRDGAPDTTFGSGGQVITPLGASRDDAAAAVAVQPDGKILVAGTTTQTGAAGRDFVVLRYLANGTLDTSFGTQGVATVDFGSTDDSAWTLLLQPDGKIVLGGDSNRGATTSGRDFALARLLPNGTLDAAFGQAGRVLTAIKADAGTDIVRALTLQTVNGQSRLVAVGGEGDFLAARYTDSGVLDTGFGTGGRVAGVFDDVIGSANAVVALPSGGLVLAGHIGHRFAAAQLTADGSLDTGFGPASDGVFVRALNPENWSEATALVRQADGALLLGGWVYPAAGSSADFAALRLTASGLLDDSFGQAGVTVKPVATGTRSDAAHALVLQADERISAVRAVLAGQANGANSDFALLRLWL